MWNGITMTSNNGWKTNNKGSEVAGATISGGTIWLRTKANILPKEQPGTFQYSSDGVDFTNLGNSVTLINNQVFFMGWRYGIFNFATKSLGGSVMVRSFAIDGTPQNSAPVGSDSSSTLASITSSTSISASSTRTSSTSTGGSAPCQTLYGQCGGRDWSGAKCCAQGTCTVSNECRYLIDGSRASLY
jgi:hypothetical protein